MKHMPPLNMDNVGATEALSVANDAAAPIAHLNQHDLADRWRISERTLERWRWLKQGPAFLRIGGRVVYRLEDIKAYELAQLRGGDR